MNHHDPLNHTLIRLALRCGGKVPVKIPMKRAASASRKTSGVCSTQVAGPRSVNRKEIPMENLVLVLR